MLKNTYFCQQKGADFSNENNYNLLSEFLCHLANSSQRPESMIKTAIAAITCLFKALGKPSPSHNSDIKRLVSF